MAKEIQTFIKLQVKGGQANPAPPIGPALGSKGVNIMEFCKQFNAQTQGVEPGTPLPVVITVYNDRSFTFITKTIFAVEVGGSLPEEIKLISVFPLNKLFASKYPLL